MSTKDELDLMIQSLEVGQEGRFVCPACGGGSTKERSLSIRKEITGSRAMCYRDSCKARYFIRASGTVRDAVVKPKPRRKLERWDGKALPAPPDWWELEALPPNLHFNMTEDSRIIIPIFDRQGGRRGDCVRQLKPYNKALPKALSLYEEGYDGMSWYRPTTKCLEMCVVEDAISAIRLACNGVVGVALLGTGLNAVRLRELRAEGLPINLALDADATLSAVRMARKFSSISKLHVHRIFKDIKDMNHDDLWNFLDELVV